MARHNCENCLIRAAHDKAPGSLVGKFWRWHINFCPGWKRYFRSLDDGKKQGLKERCQLK